MQEVGYPLITALYADLGMGKVKALVERMETLHNGGNRPIMLRALDGDAIALAWLAYSYALRITVRPTPELEPMILVCPLAAMSYARDVLLGRWPECEAQLIYNGSPQVLSDYLIRAAGKPVTPVAERLRQLGGLHYDVYQRWASSSWRFK